MKNTIAATPFTVATYFGCSSAPDMNSAADSSAPAPASPKEPVINRVRDKVTVSGGGLPGTPSEIPFTLELPPGWKWRDGQAEKSASSLGKISVSLSAKVLSDDKKTESPQSASRDRLAQLPDEQTLNQNQAGGKFTIRDRRIIKVDDIDAVWDVVAFQNEGNAQPTRLQSRCYLKLGDSELIIEGNHDEASSASAADFDDSQADILKITQSFRVDHSAAPRP